MKIRICNYYLLLPQRAADCPLCRISTLTVLDHVDEVCSPGRVALIILDILQQGEHGRARDERQTFLGNIQNIESLQDSVMVYLVFPTLIQSLREGEGEDW